METVTLKKDEYSRLRKLDKSFGRLFDYFVYLYEIADSRRQVKEKKIVPQEKLFKKLGI